MDNPTVSEILKSTLISIVRHFLSIAAAYLISKGLVAPEILSDGNLIILATGIATAIISLSWIVYQKLKTHRLVEAARVAPANAPIEEIKAAAEKKPLLGEPVTERKPEWINEAFG